jgi:hypothetical protein
MYWVSAALPVDARAPPINAVMKSERAMWPLWTRRICFQFGSRCYQCFKIDWQRCSIWYAAPLNRQKSSAKVFAGKLQ